MKWAARDDEATAAAGTHKETLLLMHGQSYPRTGAAHATNLTPAVVGHE